MNNFLTKKMTMTITMEKIKRQHQCKIFRKSFFFGLKFSLNLLEYKAKGFIHEKISFLFNFAFLLWRVGRLSYGYSNFKRVFLETLFKTARNITRTIFNIFFSNFNHIFQTTFWRETRTDFSISSFKQFL